jgi:hypothetical protein
MTTVTDTRGEYRLTPLPIGTYTVEYTLAGFGTIRQEAVRLTAGFTAKLDVVMKVGTVEQLVTVTGGSPQVDVTATNTVTQITKEALESIPTGRNGYIGLMQMTPAARCRRQYQQHESVIRCLRTGRPGVAVDRWRRHEESTRKR